MPLGMETADWFMREAQRRLSSGDWLPFARVDPKEPEDPNPTWNKQIARSVGDTISDDPATAREIANQIGVPLEMLLGEVPYVGQGLAADEVKHSYDQGDWLGVGLNALDVLPAGGLVAKAAGPFLGALGGVSKKLDDVLRVVPDDPASVTAKGKNPENFHGVGGGVKLQRPFSEMTSTSIPTGPMTPSRPLDPADLQGGIIMPLYGDKSAAGQTLTHVNDEALPRPQELQGGARFMQENPGQIWASEQGPMTTMSNRVRALAERTGKPIYGAHVAMGPEGGDFARMTTRPLLDMAKQAPIKRADLKLFDEEMGKKTGGNWPGLKNAGDRWLAEAPGTHRAAIPKLMALSEFQKAGFPDVGSLRKAITDPDLVNRPMLTSGRTVGRFDPMAKLSPSGHDTYKTQIAGDYLGDLGFLPPEALFPDFMKTQEGMAAPMVGKSFQTKLITQEADQQWLDNLMAILEGRAK